MLTRRTPTPEPEHDGDPDLVEVRLVVPRQVFVQPSPAPEYVSQANSLDVLGVPKRRFLEIVRSPSYAGRVVKLGRLRLVRRTELVAHLEQLAEQTMPNRSQAQRVTTAPVSLAHRLGLEEVFHGAEPKGK